MLHNTMDFIEELCKYLCTASVTGIMCKQFIQHKHSYTCVNMNNNNNKKNKKNIWKYMI